MLQRVGKIEIHSISEIFQRLKDFPSKELFGFGLASLWHEALIQVRQVLVGLQLRNTCAEHHRKQPNEEIAMAPQHAERFAARFDELAKASRISTTENLNMSVCKR
jgi:hypothetical protein